MDKPTEAPIFFDHKGRRWRKIVTGLLVVLAVLAGFLYINIPQVLSSTPLAPYAGQATPGDAMVKDSASAMSPSEIAAVAGRTNTPVIGQGPLVRIVHIQQANNTFYAAPLYTKTGAIPLTQQERLIVGDHEFAIQRYGQPASGKQIALTYDDGPDPTYTPRVLDILSKNNIQATFFVTGDNVVKHSAIAERTANEGHVVANHTFNHVDFDFVGTSRGKQELIQTNRVITAATNTRSSFFRLPYMGNDEQSMRNHILGILTAQQLGYIIAGHNFDSDDYLFDAGAEQVLPAFDGQPIVALLHDAGGDRTQTIAYTERIIAEAKSKGYSFITLNQMYTQTPPLVAAASPSIADRTSFILASAYLVWPREIVTKLFFLTVIMLFLTMVVNIALAVYNMLRRHRFARRPRGYNPLVSVVISAYNEESVLSSTVRSILASNYRNLEIVIVDDGSKDNTGAVAAELDKRYKRVRAFTKPNGGKSSGLNFGIKHAKGEIIVGIDADTIFPPATMGQLVRHFADPEVGAVAGNVKVGNIQNIVTRWQMLDYIIGIHIERNAQAALGAVMIVPGACGAWRRSVVLAAGGYKHVTLAEDFDLTLSVHRLGYKVLQDNSAISYTEAPDNIPALTKQRFRWMYGTFQAFWKHRDMFFRTRYGWVGMFVMPLAVFNAFLPLFFIPILVIINIENIVSGNFTSLIFFFFATIAVQAFMATVAVLLARERLSHLLAIPFTRLVYSPIRTMLLYRTALRALRGAYAGSVWNTTRTASMTYGAEPKALKVAQQRTAEVSVES